MKWSKYLISMVIISLLLSSCLWRKGKIPSLKEEYSYTNKKPFGGYMAYEGLGQYFHTYPTIIDKSYPLDVAWSDTLNKEKSLYFILTNSFLPYQNEKETIRSFVERGNDVFISANTFDPDFLKELNVDVDPVFWMQQFTERRGGMSDTKVEIALGKNMPDIPFEVFYYPFVSNFTREGKIKDILGKNEKGKPNFIVLFMGKGKIYLHAAPRALGNYFLLTNNNYKYLNYVLNYIDNRPDNIYWDEVYTKPRSPEKADPDFKVLQVIMEQPALKWAFYLGLFGLVTFLLSSMIRRQRVVPIQHPEANTSVDFTETVARLYYVHKDNKNIASKLITYFYENIKRKYLLTPSGTRDDFALRLSGKRNWSIEEVNELLNLIDDIKQAEVVSDEQLVELNKLLENFYKSE